MTRQTWTAVVSAVCFVALALMLALVPVPFVAWGPGRTLNLLGPGDDGKQAIQVKGLKTHPTTGELRMTTVSVTKVDSRLSLPEALFAHWLPKRDVLEREVVYPHTKTVDQVKSEEVAMMDDSKSEAVVAALRAAKQPVRAKPMVKAVGLAGPSFNKLQPGDLIERVDQTEVQTPQDVGNLVQKHAVGDPVVLSVLRDQKVFDVTVTTVSSNQDKKVAVIGISVVDGYVFAPRVDYGIDPEVVGPSAGLVFSLAIYDLITPGDLLGGRKVAVTGQISADGQVRPIGGIQEKVAGAENAGAQVFLVPSDNCADVQGVDTDMTMVKVGTMNEAVDALTTLRETGETKDLPRC
ncbi:MULTISPECIES: YlbL family protein [unclassified Luteococcus]|uniref:YlbL family protein n=1 Tax=unclassified Luteococcus TaxID=2639923 RepID=UPI00313A7D46